MLHSIRYGKLVSTIACCLGFVANGCGGDASSSNTESNLPDGGENNGGADSGLGGSGGEGGSGAEGASDSGTGSGMSEGGSCDADSETSCGATCCNNAKEVCVEDECLCKPHTECEPGYVCTEDHECWNGCMIMMNGDWWYFDPGVPSPNSPCLVCDPPRSTLGWLPRGVQFQCAQGHHCSGSACIPDIPCAYNEEICGSAADATCCDVSNNKNECVDDECKCVPGEPCDGGGEWRSVCDNNRYCREGCMDDGAFYGVNQAHISEPCRTCAGVGFAYGLPGSSCGPQKVCEPVSSGSSTTRCSTGCYVGGVFYPPGRVGTTSTRCDPSIDTHRLVGLTEGPPCNIGGSRPWLSSNPSNSCQYCNSNISDNSWSYRDEGYECEPGKVCRGSTPASRACVDGCWIGGFVAPFASEPGNTCKACVPAQTVLTYSQAQGLGVACASGKVCNGSMECVDGCFIGGAVRTPGAQDPSNPCRTCQPTLDRTAWRIEPGRACNRDGGSMCNLSGECVKHTPGIAAGRNHSCGIVAGGRVKCWGGNEYRQLGFEAVMVGGEWATAYYAWVVDDVQGAVALAAGHHHTCALLVDGNVTCWGLNADGQLGNGSSYGRFAHRVLPEGTSAKSISAGAFHTLVTVSRPPNGNVILGWGRNNFLQANINNHPDTNVFTPTELTRLGSLDLGDMRYVVGGAAHSCLVKNGTPFPNNYNTRTSSLACWGSNQNGQWGDGTIHSSIYPSAVVPLLNHDSTLPVAAGDYHSCAIEAGGAAWCWGQNNGRALGHSAAVSVVPTPAKAAKHSMAPYTAITAGYAHTCALDSTGHVFCWGSSAHGQAGRASGNSASPEEMWYDDWVAISAGYEHTCGIRADGRAMCWGRNTNNQLGNYGGADMHTPITVRDFQ